MICSVSRLLDDILQQTHTRVMNKTHLSAGLKELTCPAERAFVQTIVH